MRIDIHVTDAMRARKLEELGITAAPESVAAPIRAVIEAAIRAQLSPNPRVFRSAPCAGISRPISRAKPAIDAKRRAANDLDEE